MADGRSDQTENTSQRVVLTRRNVVRTAAWATPAVVVATAAPALAVVSGTTTTSIAVTTGHDYRSTQTPGAAPTDASGTGGACRDQASSGTGSAASALYVILRVTNTGSQPLGTGFMVTFTANGAGNGITPDTIDASAAASWAAPTGTTQVTSLTYTYAGAPIAPGGTADLVGRVIKNVGGGTTSDVPVSVLVSGANIDVNAVGKYGAPNATTAVRDAFNTAQGGTWLYATSNYPGSNGCDFGFDTGLKSLYSAYYLTHGG